MSAGHSHTRPNEKHPVELRKILQEPTAAAMVAHPPRPIYRFDTPYTGGYPVLGNWRYFDPIFYQAVTSGHFLGGAIAVPNMTAQDILHAVWLHEFIERTVLDADNDIDTYQDAHEFATAGEHGFVRSKKAKPYLYEKMLKPIIDFVASKPIVNVRQDLSCVPMRDREDHEDAKILSRLAELGVVDAPKVAQESVNYGRSTGQDKCIGCKHWQGARVSNPDPNVPFTNLAVCAKVDGAVRDNRWCKLFEEFENGNQNQEVPPGSTS